MKVLEENRKQEMKVIKNDQDVVLGIWLVKDFLRRLYLYMGNKLYVYLGDFILGRIISKCEDFDVGVCDGGEEQVEMRLERESKVILVGFQFLLSIYFIVCWEVFGGF